MRYVLEDVLKIPVGAKIHLSGSILEIIREGKTTYSYQTIDMSKFDLHCAGQDSEGFLNFHIFPCNSKIPSEPNYREDIQNLVQCNVFDPKRKRIQGDVKIPENFVPYLEYESQHGGKYRVFVNERKHFILKIETSHDYRLHNLGELGSPKGYLTKFFKMLQEWGEWLSRAQIKNKLYEARMYDGQKLTIGLLILEKEGLIKTKDGLYAPVELDLDTGVIRDFAEQRQKEERQDLIESLETEITR